MLKKIIYKIQQELIKISSLDLVKQKLTTKKPKTQTKSHELFTQLNHFPFNPAVFSLHLLAFPHHEKII